MKTTILLAALFSAALGACRTAPKSTITEIVSDPAGAEVQIVGFGTCITPCRIEIDRPRNITVARAGFLAERFQIAPGQKSVTLALKLAAPTKDVDKTELPDLK